MCAYSWLIVQNIKFWEHKIPWTHLSLASPKQFVRRHLLVQLARLAARIRSFSLAYETVRLVAEINSTRCTIVGPALILWPTKISNREVTAEGGTELSTFVPLRCKTSIMTTVSSPLTLVQQRQQSDQVP